MFQNPGDNSPGDDLSNGKGQPDNKLPDWLDYSISHRAKPGVAAGID
jgi:hypothetical protein